LRQKTAFTSLGDSESSAATQAVHESFRIYSDSTLPLWNVEASDNILILYGPQRVNLGQYPSDWFPMVIEAFSQEQKLVWSAVVPVPQNELQRALALPRLAVSVKLQVRCANGQELEPTLI
jgi:hypothetical protein